MAQNAPAVILLVEDDAGHVRLIEKNLLRVPIATSLIVLNDGQEAVDYLFKANQYVGAQHPLPDIILLDLDLPSLNGNRVLASLKTDRRTRQIPVIMASTNDDPNDIQQCYVLGCHTYLIKPIDDQRLSEVIHRLGPWSPRGPGPTSNHR